MKFSRSSLFAVAVSFAMSTSAVALQTSSPEVAAETQIHRVVERFDVKPGQRIRVVNRHGNIRLREVPLASRAELALTVQLEGETPNPVGAATTMADDGVLDVEITSETPLDALDELLRIDLTLAVPDHVELLVELENGNFTMPSASYPLTLRAQTASVRIRTSGRVDVETMDGKVVYLPPRDREPAGGRIQTSRAPVDVLMIDPEALSFEAVSGAAVTTDSLAFLQRREKVGRVFRFPGHEGSGVLSIQTDEAPIRFVFEGIR